MQHHTVGQYLVSPLFASDDYGTMVTEWVVVNVRLAKHFQLLVATTRGAAVN